MQVKLNRQKKLPLSKKLKSVTEIQEAFAFLYPELTDEQIKNKLLFTLVTIADSKHLQALWDSTNKLANNKVDEVTDLYCNFFSDDFNGNDN